MPLDIKKVFKIFFKLLVDRSLSLAGNLWRVILLFKLLMLIFPNWPPSTQSRQEYFFCNTTVAKCKNDCTLEYSPEWQYKLWKIQVTKLNLKKFFFFTCSTSPFRRIYSKINILDNYSKDLKLLLAGIFTLCLLKLKNLFPVR